MTTRVFRHYIASQWRMLLKTALACSGDFFRRLHWLAVEVFENYNEVVAFCPKHCFMDVFHVLLRRLEQSLIRGSLGRCWRARSGGITLKLPPWRWETLSSSPVCGVGTKEQPSLSSRARHCCSLREDADALEMATVWPASTSVLRPCK